MQFLMGLGLLATGISVLGQTAPTPEAPPASLHLTDLHTFTGAGGKTIEAQIIGYAANTILLLREDGQTVPGPVASFGKSDQDYIAQYVLKNAAKIGAKLFELKAEPNSPDVLSGGGSSNRRNSTWLISYKVTLTNVTKFTIPAPTIQYIAACNPGKSDEKVINEITFGTEQPGTMGPGASITFGTTPHTGALTGLQIRVCDSSGQVLQKLDTTPLMETRIYVPFPKSGSGTAYNSGPHTAEQEAEALRHNRGLWNYIVQPSDAERSAKDATSTRLLRMLGVINHVLESMQDGPTEIFRQPVADVMQAQAAVAKGQGYLKAHPEIESLRVRTQDKAASRFVPVGLEVVGLTDKRLKAVADDLTAGLNEFIGDLSAGRPIVGEMGGARDEIIREVARAVEDIGLGTKRSPGSPLQVVVGTSATAAVGRLGSISGTVVVPPGNARYAYPTSLALIRIAALDASVSETGANATLPAGAIPATLTDDKGDFVIREVPPGIYALSAGSNAGVVEVKEGAEAKLSAPLLVAQFGVGRK